MTVTSALMLVKITAELVRKKKHKKDEPGATFQRVVHALALFQSKKIATPNL